MSPTTCFRSPDLPVPLRPMMARHSPRGTSRSSPRSTSFLPKRIQTPRKSIAVSGKDHPEEERGEEVVDDQDEEAGGDHGVGRRDADPLRAPLALQSEVAPHHRDDPAEEERLDQAREHVLRL